MTYQEQRRTTIVRDPAEPARPGVVPGPGYAMPGPGYLEHEVVDQRKVAVVRPSGGTVAARLATMIFGLIQLVVVLRMVFLVFDAREANGLVAGILSLSQVFVAPFEGVFRTAALTSGGSVFDIAALAALIGWTIIELIVLGFMRVRRPGEDV